MSDTDVYAAVEWWVDDILTPKRVSCMKERLKIEQETDLTQRQCLRLDPIEDFVQPGRVHAVAAKMVSVMTQGDLSTPLDSLSFTPRTHSLSAAQTEAYSMANKYVPDIFSQYKADIKTHAEELWRTTLRRGGQDFFGEITLENCFQQPIYKTYVEKQVTSGRLSRPHYKLADELIYRLSAAKPRASVLALGGTTEMTDPGLEWLTQERGFQQQIHVFKDQLVGLKDDYDREVVYEDQKLRSLDSTWVVLLKTEMQQSKLFDASAVMHDVRLKHVCGSEPSLLLRVYERIEQARSVVLDQLDVSTQSEFIKLLDDAIAKCDAPRPEIDRVMNVTEEIIRHRACNALSEWASTWTKHSDKTKGHWPAIDEASAPLTSLIAGCVKEWKDPGYNPEMTYAENRRKQFSKAVDECFSWNCKRMLKAMKDATQARNLVNQIFLSYNWRAQVREVEGRPFMSKSPYVESWLNQDVVDEHEVTANYRNGHDIITNKAVGHLDRIIVAMNIRTTEWETHGKQLLWVKLFESRTRECMRGSNVGDKILRSWWQALLSRLGQEKIEFTLNKICNGGNVSTTLTTIAKRMLLSCDPEKRTTRQSQPLLVSWHESQQTIMMLQWTALDGN
jgi:hypothetical protein